MTPRQKTCSRERQPGTPSLKREESGKLPGLLQRPLLRCFAPALVLIFVAIGVSLTEDIAPRKLLRRLLSQFCLLLFSLDIIVVPRLCQLESLVHRPGRACQTSAIAEILN